MTRIVKPLTAAERSAMVAYARTFLDVPFRHRGRSRRGIDCVGLVAVALASVSRTIRERESYGRDPVKDGLRDELLAHLGKPISGDLKPGDVVLMRWHEADGVPLFNHVAIVTGYPLGGLALLHAYAHAKRVVEHRLADPWPRRIVEVYRP